MAGYEVGYEAGDAGDAAGAAEAAAARDAGDPAGTDADGAVTLAGWRAASGCISGPF